MASRKRGAATLPPAAHFDYGNLYAQVPFSAETHSRAARALQLDVRGPADLSNRTDFNTLTREITIVGIVEHEYFHCRNMLSTPIGYALFILRQILINQRRKMLQLFWEQESAREFIKGNDIGGLFKATEAGKVPKQVADWWCKIHIWLATFKMLLEPDVELLHVIQGFQEVGDFGFRPFSGRAYDGTDRYLPQVESLAAQSIITEEFTVPHLMEALAIWKEYGYIARLASTTRDFRGITDQWVKRWQGEDLYSRALDAIFVRTGCNASTALPGVLLEIALTCPIFSSRSCDWDEFHPSARFRRILDIVSSLPLRLRGPRPDNLDIVDQTYYQDVERYVCESLGWASSSENLKSSMEAIKARVEYGRKESRNDATDVLGQLMDRRFLQAHHHRTEELGLMLFPWNHPQSQIIGGHTMPPVTVFDGTLEIHPWHDEEPWMFELFLKDLVISLTLEAMIHPHRRMHLPFKRARGIFAQIRKTIGEEKFRYGDGTFEALISSYLGFDYKRLRTALAR